VTVAVLASGGDLLFAGYSIGFKDAIMDSDKSAFAEVIE
jgi:hypothetical protein